MTDGTDMPRAIRGVIAVLAHIAKVRRTTRGGYRALPGPVEPRGLPPTSPKPSKGGATPAAMRAGKRILKRGAA